MLIVNQEARFKAYKGQLLYLLQERDRVRPLMAPVLQGLCRGLWDELARRLEPGLVSILWTSLEIPGYIEGCLEMVHRLEILLLDCGQIITNRIEKRIEELRRMLLTDIEEPMPRQLGLR